MTCGFDKNLINSLICQQDNSVLCIKEIFKEDGHTIFEGLLICQKCSTIYDIKNGILNLLSQQDSLDQIMNTEIEARDKEAAAYDQRLAIRYDKEIPSTLKAIGRTKDKKLIEYGCGTGRLTTEIVPQGGQLLAIDFSQESLLILAQKLAGQNNIGLVLANAANIKTAPEFFDTALSFQFLEHVPGKDKRDAWLELVRQTLKNNGQFISTVYHYDLRKKLKKEEQEGKHSSGIFFHYFLASEIKSELKKYFKIKNIHPIDITLPLESRLKIPIKAAGRLSRLAEHIPFINKFGHLLIIHAAK